MSTLTASADLARPLARLARWRVLTGAILIQLILGTVYGYSIFWQPLENSVFPRVVTASERAQMTAGRSEFAGLVVLADEAAVKARHNRQIGDLAYAFAICILAFAAVMVFAGRVQDVRGPRFTAIVGAALMGLGFLLAGVALGAMPGASPALKLWVLWATVGLVAGAGIGFAYVCPIAALIKWFPESKGLVSGLAVAGFGFGAFIFSNKDWAVGAPGYITAHGIAAFFITHGVVCMAAVLLGALMLSNPPGTTPKAAAETDWKGTLRQPAFWMLWPMFFSGALAGLTVIGVMKVFAGEQLVKAAHLSLSAPGAKALLEQGARAVGWLAIFNAAGRIVWGLVSDRIGRTSAFVAMFVFQAVMMFLLAGMQQETALAVGASLVGFNFGGNFALFPSATADLFGAKNLGANYSLVFTSYGIAGVVGIYTGNLVKAATGSFDIAFYIAGALCLVSAGLAFALRRAGRRQAEAA